MKFVVIDDDPTGSQTVQDCLLLLKWDFSTLAKGFESNLIYFLFWLIQGHYRKMMRN